MSEQLRHVALPLVGHICQRSSSHGTPDLSLLISESCQMAVPESLCLHWSNLFVSRAVQPSPVFVPASVHTPTVSRSIPGSPEPALPLPAGELPQMSDSALLNSYTSFYLLPWDPRAWGSAGMESPLLLLPEEFRRCEPAHRLQEERLEGRGAHLPTLSPYRPKLSLRMAAVAQSEFLLLLSLWRELCQEGSSEHCGRARHLPAQQPLVFWPYDHSPSDNCCRMASRATTAPFPPLQGYHSLASPEPAPAAEAAAQALLLCLTSSPGCGGHSGSNLGSSVSVPTQRWGWWMAGPASFFSPCRVRVAPLTPEAGEWDIMTTARDTSRHHPCPQTSSRVAPWTFASCLPLPHIHPFLSWDISETSAFWMFWLWVEDKQSWFGRVVMGSWMS